MLLLINSRKIRWAGYGARMWESRNAHRVLVWKYERRKTLESTRPKWKNDIKMQKKVRWEGIDVLFWLRMGVTGELLWVTNVQIPYKLENFLASFLRRALALWN